MVKSKTMTAKEKAKELVNKLYQPLGYLSCGVSSNEMWEHAKNCALILVDEILNLGLREYLPEGGVPAMRGVGYYRNPTIVFWENVKTEIEKL